MLTRAQETKILLDLGGIILSLGNQRSCDYLIQLLGFCDICH